MSEENNWLPTNNDLDSYNLLKDLLYSQKNEFDLLSKEKTDERLNPMKIKIANRVLMPLKELFKQEDYYEYLDTLVEDDKPTNSDVVLIISQYQTAINSFHESYYQKDKYVTGKSRWMTKEFPPEYNKDNINIDGLF